MYARTQLSLGGPIAEALQAILVDGQVWEFANATHDFNAGSVDFQIGGHFTAEESTECTLAYEEFLNAYLAEDEASLLILENQLFRMSDPIMSAQSEVFELGGTLYFYYPTASERATALDVSSVLPRASWNPYIVLATRMPPSFQLPQRAELSADSSQVLIDSVEHILVGAYDGEGFVAWSRQRRSSVPV